jgi:hypothetical protein
MAGYSAAVDLCRHNDMIVRTDHVLLRIIWTALLAIDDQDPMFIYFAKMP